MKLFIIGARGKLGSCIAARAETVDAPEGADVVIDVSSPSALDAALSYQKPLVIGTTGHSPDQIAQIHRADLPIFMASNFSPGIALLKRFLTQHREWFDRVTIEDIHHSEKKDAPSGTALTLANCLTRPPEIVSKREGDTVGIHSIELALDDETLLLKHTAHSRDLFARGAIEAATFLMGKKPGLYSMNDLIESTTI